MTCEKVRNLLGPYVDGEAAPDVRREVEAHVSDCYACSEDLQEILRSEHARLARDRKILTKAQVELVAPHAAKVVASLSGYLINNIE